MPVFLFERSKEIVRHLQHLPDTLRDGDLVTGYNILKDQVNNIKIQFIRETVKEDLSAG